MYPFQEDLIRHLCRYNILGYDDCLEMLDPCELHTLTERSYMFRPLTRQGYLQKRDDRVTVLAKGRALYPELEPLVSLGGGKTNIERLMQVSRMAMRLEPQGHILSRRQHGAHGVLGDGKVGRVRDDGSADFRVYAAGKRAASPRNRTGIH